MLRSHRQNVFSLPANWAELALETGRHVRSQIRRGRRIEDVACDMELMPDDCALSLQFLTSSDRLKLRAMVEDWSPERFVAELGDTSHLPGENAVVSRSTNG